MWYALYQWHGEGGWRRKNVFEDQGPDLARSMLLVGFDDELTGSVALVEADTREEAESFPAYNTGWRRIGVR